MKYIFNGYIVEYLEYGAGAEIVAENGAVIANFPNHLDAEVFLESLQKVEKKRLREMPKMPLDLAIKKTSLEWKKEDLVSHLRETAHKVVELAENGTLAHISETEEPCLQIRIMKNFLIALKEIDLLQEEVERNIRRSSPV